MRRALSLTSMLLLAACANGAGGGGISNPFGSASPAASSQADQEAKSFPPPANEKGALYIYRKELMGFARPVDVAIANGASARLPINSYLRLEGPPGPVEIDCKVGDNQNSAQIEVAQGRTRFVEVSMTTGLWSPGCQVAEVAPDVGRAAVRASHRVERQ